MSTQQEHAVGCASRRLLPTEPPKHQPCDCHLARSPQEPREQLIEIASRAMARESWRLADDRERLGRLAAAVIDALVADHERLVEVGARAVDLTNPWGDRMTSESAARAVLDGIGLGARASSTRKTG